MSEPHPDRPAFLAAFAAYEAEERALAAEHAAFQRAAEQAFADATVEAFRAWKPRAKDTSLEAARHVTKGLPHDQRLEILERGQALVDAWMVARKARYDAREQAMAPWATRAELLESGGAWRELDTLHGSTHRSTMRGSIYAWANAMTLVDNAKEHGVPARLVELRREGSNPYECGTDWRVEIRVATDADEWLLRKLPGLPLREVVRRLWARTANPRVLMPFLPHGCEREWGFNEQGLPAPPPDPRRACPPLPAWLGPLAPPAAPTLPPAGPWADDEGGPSVRAVNRCPLSLLHRDPRCEELPRWARVP